MSRSASFSELYQIDLFSGLEPDLLAQLAAQSRLIIYDTHDVIFHEGDQLPACLHLLVSGQLRVIKVAASGKETILRLLHAGEVFAAPALFGNGQAPATVIASAPAKILTLEKQVLLQGFAQNPELALHLLEIFNQRLQQLHNRVHGLVSERAIVRLVHYLEHVASEKGTVPVNGGEQLRSNLTYYQIARTIGISYEECVRLVKQLHTAISYQRGGVITILNWQLLKQIEH